MSSQSPTPLEAGDVTQALAAAVETVRANVAPFAQVYPDDTTTDNVYRARRRPGLPDGTNVGWTTGFWPGMIWLASEATGDAALENAARAHVSSFADRIERRFDTATHDLGFLYTLSCTVAADRAGDAAGRAAGLAAADALMDRFLPAPGIFQAWGELDDPDQRGRTIIDSLMNMPLLHWASRESGSPHYAEAARRHVSQLAAQMFREDDSTFHTYYWDAESGEPLRGGTEQGSADDSCWARGQAWGVYGFALNFRLTGEQAFLDAALRCARYILARVGDDLVPAWDLSESGQDGSLPDSSAAAIVAAGLLEIDSVSGGDADLRDTAERIMGSLVRSYTPAPDGDSNALIVRGVYDMPKNVGVDEGTLWGDYFYLETLVRLSNPGRTPAW